VLISVVITAAKYSATTLNPNNRTALIEYAKDLMIISICLWHLDFFYNFIFDLNSWIIVEFKEALGNFNPDQQIPLLNNGLADNKTITELSMKDHKNDYMFIIFGL
ncbi:hypothetical protein, partial [Bacillus thuringiensis]